MDEWTLKDKLGSLLSGAVYSSDAFLRRLQGILLDDEQGLEAGDSYSNLRYNSKVKNFALELYKQQYGEAIPVAKQDEVRDIEALGRRAVVVNPLMYSFVHSEFPSLQSLRGAEASKVVEVHYDLTGDEQQHLELCSGLAGVTPFVATFGSPLIRSSTRDDKLYVARHLLADPSELLVQLIREKVIADSEGGDVNGSIAKELARLALR